jgi:hypothetical protein
MGWRGHGLRMRNSSELLQQARLRTDTAAGVGHARELRHWADGVAGMGGCACAVARCCCSKEAVYRRGSVCELQAFS